jgi:hypothetical protein
LLIQAFATKFKAITAIFVGLSTTHKLKNFTIRQGKKTGLSANPETGAYLRKLDQRQEFFS